MNIISVNKLTKLGRDDYLFREVTFGLELGEKAALIGKNGTGKSTLLKTIAGELLPDGGTVSLNRDAGISYLSQEHHYENGDTIRQHIFKSSAPKMALIREYEELCGKIAIHKNTNNDKRLEEILLQMDRDNVWSYENEIRSILNTLGINDLELKMETLSGGMLKKVELAQVLIDDTKLLLLDEPTNHLDISTIEWLEEYLKKTQRAVLMVTHDRYFLDHICDSLYELERGDLKLYKGNFSYYLEKKAEADAVAVSNEQKTESILRKEMEWLRRGPKARGTKAKARKDMINKLINRDKLAEEKGFAFEITGRRLGSKILELDDIAKQYGEKTLFSHFTYVFKRGEKIGLFGENGTGKTTFLNIIMGLVKPDSGRVDAGQNTQFAYYRQNPEIPDKEITVLEYIKESAEMIKLPDGVEISASKLLERFGFSGKIQHSSITTLSGGEKKRVYLVRLLIANPNFLILDEPTNDLDIYTLSVLEDFLDSFGGCLIVVSHDRYFMDRCVDSLLIFGRNGEISGFAGSCSEYIDFCAENVAAAAAESRENSAPREKKMPQKETRRKLTFKETKELETIESEIEELENEKGELEGLLSSGETDHVKLREWSQRFDRVSEMLTQKYQRWEELASLQ